MVARPQILVVDDDREMILLLRDFLTRQGYDVAVADSGKGALRLLEQSHPQRLAELVLSDVKMSPVNGLELAALLRLDRPHLPVILFSAYCNGGLEKEAIRAGARKFLRKPFGLNQIAAIVKEELGRISKKK